jgi:hypothetical protein
MCSSACGASLGCNEMLAVTKVVTLHVFQSIADTLVAYYLFTHGTITSHNRLLNGLAAAPVPVEVKMV